jgi:hypothetical protein
VHAVVGFVEGRDNRQFDARGSLALADKIRWRFLLVGALGGFAFGVFVVVLVLVRWRWRRRRGKGVDSFKNLYGLFIQKWWRHQLAPP